MSAPGRPGIPFYKDFSIGGHTRFGEAERALQSELHADHLFDTVVPKVSVLGSEGGFWINTDDLGVNRLRGIGIQVKAGGLTEFDIANLTLREQSHRR